MISLQGTRVFLLDDSLEEAIPIIKAFAKRGIPIVFYDGNIDDLPDIKEKLTGVRLAILDMDLIGGGGSDDNKISTLIARLQGILASDNGPYTMVAWTKHAHLVELFEAKLFMLFQSTESQDKVPLPLISIRLEKQDFLIKGPNDPDLEATSKPQMKFDFDKLSSTVEAVTKISLPLSIMQTWENRCLRAASEVTNNLSDMVTTTGNTLAEWRDTWNKAYLGLLTSLAKEEIGEDNLNKTTFLDALFSVLNPLHMDFLETDHSLSLDLPEDIIPLPVNGKKEQDIVPPPVKGKKEQDPLAGRINTRFHLSIESPNQFRPGNIYKLIDCEDIFPIKPRAIFDDLIQTKLEDKDAVFSKVTSILLEVSASCDYAQNKIKFARFLAGLDVPQNEIGKFKHPNYKQPFEALLSLGPLWIEKQDRYILLSSQYLVSLEIDRAKLLKPFARLRSQWLTNVQFWLAQQLSRPGIVMLK